MRELYGILFGVVLAGTIAKPLQQEFGWVCHFAPKTIAQEEEESVKRTLWSWVAYSVVILMGLRIYYGWEWREFGHLDAQEAWRLRLSAFGAVMLISAIAAAISLLLTRKVRRARGLVAGILTGLMLRWLAEWIGDYYLGGTAHYDAYRWGALMVEGYGMMMFMLVAPGIGVLAWIRSEVASWRTQG